jgi:uncharacterized cysteine cluster protein YcgN (CxxCxxCC family)
MIKKIPEQIEVYCDICGVLCNNSMPGTKGSRRMKTVLKFKCLALDYRGDACGSWDTDLDLCDQCSKSVIKFINTLANKRTIG